MKWATPVNILLDLSVVRTFLLAAEPQEGSFLLGLAIIVLLMFSFFLSTAEVAFFSMNFKEVSLLKTRKDSSWKRIAELLEDPGLLMASLRIAGILVNIALVLFLSMFIENIVGNDGQWAGSGGRDTDTGYSNTDRRIYLYRSGNRPQLYPPGQASDRPPGKTGP